MTRCPTVSNSQRTLRSGATTRASECTRSAVHGKHFKSAPAHTTERGRRPILHSPLSYLHISPYDHSIRLAPSRVEGVGQSNPPAAAHHCRSRHVCVTAANDGLRPAMSRRHASIANLCFRLVAVVRWGAAERPLASNADGFAQSNRLQGRTRGLASWLAESFRRSCCDDSSGVVGRNDVAQLERRPISPKVGTAGWGLQHRSGLLHRLRSMSR